MRRAGPPIPNGCGTRRTEWVPDSLGSVDFRRCCDAHDLAWSIGGTLGGALPWRRAGQWEWRFVGSNLGLSRCIRDRFAGRGRAWAGWIVGPLYFAAVSTVGLMAWRWRSPTGGRVPSGDELAALMPVSSTLSQAPNLDAGARESS